MSGVERWARLYPRSWRERYGSELVALMEDSGELSVRHRADVVRAAVAEHWRAFDPGGGDGRVLGGSLLVLCGWAFVVIGGSGFAKFSEHWDAFTPAPARWLPAAAYAAVVVAAMVGAVAVVLAASSVLPAFVRLLRSGRWSQVRAPILGAGAFAAATGAVSGGVIMWAHHLGSVQRNGGSAAYAAVGAGWVLMMVTSLALGTAAAVGTVRKLDLSDRVIRFNGALARVVVLAMAVIVAGVVTWWVAVAVNAPTFVSGAPLPLVIAAGALLAGLGLGAVGFARVVRGPAG